MAVVAVVAGQRHGGRIIIYACIHRDKEAEPALDAGCSFLRVLLLAKTRAILLHFGVSVCVAPQLWELGWVGEGGGDRRGKGKKP